MITNEKTLKQADAFAKSYDVDADGVNVDVAGQVAAFRRIREVGSDIAVHAHARALVNMAGSLGLLTDEGPTKADLQEEAGALGLSKSGTKAEIAERIAEHKAGA